MKLTIFQADKGDCILLESKDGKRILCDGGMSRAMKATTAQELAKLRKANKVIDFAYVSHIDQDHIAGVLELLQNEVAWRAFDHQKKLKNKKAKAPEVPRPPEIGGIWHNSFRAQLKGTGKKTTNKLEAIEGLLAAAGPALLATRLPRLEAYGEELYGIATSIPEAIKVSRLASPEILGIPINVIPGGGGEAKLLKVQPGQKAFGVGGLSLTIIGPTQKELNSLQKGWNTWVVGHEKEIKAIEAEMQRKINSLGTAQAGGPLQLDWNGIPDFEHVTAPNIASLMFMVQEGSKTLLLTGDAHHDFILRGLETTGFLNGKGLHLDVLKVQHHGSEHNMDKNFAAQVSADHYIFSGNGENTNPEISVVEMVFNSRLGSDSKLLAKAPAAAGRPFKLWFSSSEKNGPVNLKGEAHMRAVQKRVAKLVKQSGGRMTAEFNTGNFLTLTV